MDTSTFDLYRVLQSGPFDEAGLSQVKRLLGGQRRLLRGKSDWKTLEQLIDMLQDWALAAGGGWLGASALAEAAEIAELDLRNVARAEQLRSQAIVTGRAASGLPAAPPVTNEGAIDANAELLHELKTLPPGALTQAFLSDAATEFEEEVRRSSSIPARPRTIPGMALPALPSETAQRRRISSVPAQPGAAAAAAREATAATPEGTQEVQTIDLELTSIAPLTAADDALSAQITSAEQVLETDTSPDRVRELAELYAKRDETGDREQAAVLYTTLGEVLGNPGGIPMLERALLLVPDYAEAKALLTRYAVPRMRASSPRITVLGTQPRVAMPQPPPAAARAVPPLAAAAAVGQSSALSAPPLSAAAAAQASHASLAPRASVAPVGHTTLHGHGPANDVLSLHGVPQVVTTPPATPQISSLSPIVRSDATQLKSQHKQASIKRLVVPGGLVLSVAAAFALYFGSHARNGNEVPGGSAVLTTSSNAPEMGAASQPPLEVPDMRPEPAGQQNSPPAAAADQARADAPAPLAPPGPSHLPALKFEAAQLRGGKLSEAQLSEALDKAEPKFLACYEQASENKPRLKGRVIYGFTVRTNGRVTNIKRVGGTLRDEALLQCSVKVLETMRFPKPRKQSAQVKLPIQYKRT